jgi:hypothetical protein
MFFSWVKRRISSRHSWRPNPDCLTPPDRLWEARTPSVSSLALTVYAVKARRRCVGVPDQRGRCRRLPRAFAASSAAHSPDSRLRTFQAILRLHPGTRPPRSGAAGVVSRTFTLVGNVLAPLFSNALYIKYLELRHERCFAQPPPSQGEYSHEMSCTKLS